MQSTEDFTGQLLLVYSMQSTEVFITQLLIVQSMHIKEDFINQLLLYSMQSTEEVTYHLLHVCTEHCTVSEALKASQTNLCLYDMQSTEDFTYRLLNILNIRKHGAVFPYINYAVHCTAMC